LSLLSQVGICGTGFQSPIHRVRVFNLMAPELSQKFPLVKFQSPIHRVRVFNQ